MGNRTTPPDAGRIHDITPTAIGHQPRKTDWLDRSFACVAIGLVVEGRGTFRAATSARQRVTRGTFFAVHPGTVFDYGPEPGTSWNEYHVGAVGTGLSRWQSYGWIASDGSVRTVDVSRLPALVRRFKTVIALHHSQARGDRDRCILEIERLLMELQDAARDHSTLNRPRQDPRVSAALLQLQRAPARDWSLEQLAENCGLSYSLFRKRVASYTGMPPAKYLARLRCEMACQLLRDTDQPIKSIAQRAGYIDTPTFSKAFKRTIGIPPASFRHDHQQLVGPAAATG